MDYFKEFFKIIKEGTVKTFYYLIHSFGCPNGDIRWFGRGNLGNCNKCGRDYFKKY